MYLLYSRLINIIVIPKLDNLLRKVLGVDLLWTCRFGFKAQAVLICTRHFCEWLANEKRLEPFSYITEGSCLRACLLCNVIDRGVVQILLDIQLGFREFKLLKLPFWETMILFYLDI